MPREPGTARRQTRDERPNREVQKLTDKPEDLRCVNGEDYFPVYASFIFGYGPEGEDIFPDWLCSYAKALPIFPRAPISK